MLVDLPGSSPGAAASRQTEMVLVGAHYDTAPETPGANDNGTGVAALLELAARFRQRPAPSPLRLVLFTNEEPPHFWQDSMGSLVHARGVKARAESVRAMLSLETLGFYSDKEGSQSYPPIIGWFYPTKGNFVAFVRNLQNPGLVTDSLRHFREAVVFPSEGGVFPGGMPGIGWSDHWSFWQVGVPALMVTDTAPFRDAQYHQPSDAGQHINFQRLSVVVRGVEAVVRSF